MPLMRTVGTGRGRRAAGQRNKYVCIKKVSDGEGLSGFPTETLSTLAWEWMAKVDSYGGELTQSGQLSGVVETQWHMNYRTDMDPDLVDVPKTRKLVFRGGAYDITAATSIGQNERIELMTVAQTRKA